MYSETCLMKYVCGPNSGFPLYLISYGTLMTTIWTFLTYLVSSAWVVIGSLACFTDMLLGCSAEPPVLNSGVGWTDLAFRTLLQNSKNFYSIFSSTLQAAFCENTVHTDRRPSLSMDHISSRVCVTNLTTRFTLNNLLANLVLSW